MDKHYKVWVEVEEYNPATEEYTRAGEPLDLAVGTEAGAYTLQHTLHAIGLELQNRFAKVAQHFEI